MDTLQFPAPAMKKVTIQIAEQDLAQLRRTGHRLCVAKRVDRAYNVIWQSSSQYVASNQFEWMGQALPSGSRFEIFCTNTVVDGGSVRSVTNSVPIALGEQATLDAAGIVRPPVTGGPIESVNFLNQFGPIHPGLSQTCTWIDGMQWDAPISVRTQQVRSGMTALVPVDQVLVWFEQNAGAGTIFSTPRRRAIEIDLTVADNATRLYRDGIWTLP